MTVNEMLEEVDFTCGSMIDDFYISVPVFFKDHDCVDKIERLCYAAQPKDPVCIHCGTELDKDLAIDEFFPQCDTCQEAKVPRRA